MKKRITSIVMTIVLILCCMVFNTNGNINTVNADPYNIEIRVETKEISLEEIPKNYRVEVEVYVSNVPDEDFFSFNVAYKLDPKLDDLIDRALGVDEISSISLESSTQISKTQNKYLYLDSDTIIHTYKKIKDGRIYNIKFTLPLEVAEGDFYEITPIADCGNDMDYTSFVLQSNLEEVYGPSNFSFVGGGLKIRSSHPEQPISNDPVPPADINISDSQDEKTDTQTQIINEIKEETTAPAISSETASTTMTTVSSAVISTPRITSTEHTESTIIDDVNTESVSTSESTNETSNHKNYAILIIVFILFLLITALIITIVIRKKKNSN